MSQTDVALALAVEAMAAESMWGRLEWLDRQLVPHGFHPMSPWWRATLREFYASAKQRLVLRVGRRGGKSSTLCRVAVAETVYGRWSVPAGDVGVFAFLSVRKDEARQRLLTISQILDVLGVSYSQSGDQIALHSRPAVIRVYPASFRAAVGFTCIGWVGDEVARWRDTQGANPATEVLRSVRPAMATIPTAREFLSSSPWADDDAHYRAYAEGTTPEQMTAYAETWTANPTLDKSACHRLEPDGPTFDREYRAIPMSSRPLAFFDAAAIDAAVDQHLYLPTPPQPGTVITAGADMGFRRNASALVIVHRRGDRRHVADMLELLPRRDAPLVPSEVVREMVARLRQHCAPPVMADRHYQESIAEHLREHGLRYLPAPAHPSEPFVRLRVLLHSGLLRLPAQSELQSLLRQVESRASSGGLLQIRLPQTPDGRHADLASALALAAAQEHGARIAEPVTDQRTLVERQAYSQWSRAELDDADRLAAELQRRSRPELDDPTDYVLDVLDMES